MLLIDTQDDDFEARFAARIERRRTGVRADSSAVARLLADIARRGDDGLLDYTAQYDGWRPDDARDFRVGAEDIAAARASVAPDLIAALELAYARIRAFHEKQYPSDHVYEDSAGIVMGWRWTPIDAVGLYVPGGRAVYPSSVLMNAVPASIAGVRRIVMMTPGGKGRVNPLVLAAAGICGIEEIYKIGGAQAIGALTYGTQSIARVDKIFGPGNSYVTEAKRQVFGQVGIDMVAGPSEVTIIADESAQPERVAADLLAQAEHDPLAQAVLITASRSLASSVAKNVSLLLADTPHAVAQTSWTDWGTIIIVRDAQEAMDISNRIAPEHLELAVAAPEDYLPDIRNAGSVFIGHGTPEALGDYVAGPNHVLPTCGAARFSSGLGVADFMKRTTMLKSAATPEILDAGIMLAQAEGLPAHARSLRLRKS